MGFCGGLTGKAARTADEGVPVQIDKSQILELLRSQGQHDQAQQAESELPDQVDTDRDGGLLERFGLSPQEIVTKLAGGGLGGGGLGGLLGR